MFSLLLPWRHLVAWYATEVEGARKGALAVACSSFVWPLNSGGTGACRSRGSSIESAAARSAWRSLVRGAQAILAHGLAFSDDASGAAASCRLLSVSRLKARSRSSRAHSVG